MKYLISITMIFSVVLLFSGCERNETGKMPDNIKDSNTAVLNIVRDSSDPFINLSNPGDYNLVVAVDLLFEGQFNKIDIMVAYNNNYTNQYLVTTITNVPDTITITGLDILNAVTVLESFSDIQENDAFTLFTSIELADGTYIPGYTITGAVALSPTARSIMDVLKGGTPNIFINVPCEYNEDLFLGEFDVVENFGGDYEYTVTIEKDPDYEGDDLGLLIRDIWEPGGVYRIVISKYDYSLTAKDLQTVIKAPIFTFFDPTFRGFREASANTCDGSISFTTTMCVYNAAGVYLGCFGTPVIYKLTRKQDVPTKKSGKGDLVRPERVFESL